MESINGKNVLAVRRATSSNYYPVRYNESSNNFQAYTSSQISKKTNWLVVFEETEETMGCRHTYTAETVKATCTENGFSTYTCTTCGETYTEILEATGHNYKEIVTAPDCLNGGYTTYTCQNCSNIYVDNYTVALGHHYTEKTIDSTCLEDGIIADGNAHEFAAVKEINGMIKENTRYEYLNENLSNTVNQITRLDHRLGGANLNMEMQEHNVILVCAMNMVKE